MPVPPLPHELLQRAVEHAVTGVTIADCSQPDLPLIYINPAFEQLTGYRPDEVIGKNCRFLQGAETDPGQVAKIRQAIETGTACKVTLLNYKKDGQPFWNELSMSPVRNQQGELTHFIGIHDDITARVAIEQQLIAAKEKAEAATRLKTQFFNAISHDLRTPLTVMLGNLPLLTDANELPPAEEIAEIAADISASGKHLLELINELLDLSRIEEGRMPLFPVPLNIVNVIEELLGSIGALATQKGLELHTQLQDFSFVGDAIRIKQIFSNLIGNAIKFTDQGYVKIQSYTRDNRGVVQISDTGCGMKADFLPHVFKVFRQADASPTRPKSGSGLGLAIAKKLVDMHGGEIAVESTYLKGSTFTVSFALLDKHQSQPA